MADDIPADRGDDWNAGWKACEGELKRAVETIARLIGERDEARAEVQRLANIEFEHAGCQHLRERDNAILIEQRDNERARVLAEVDAALRDVRSDERFDWFVAHGHEFEDATTCNNIADYLRDVLGAGGGDNETKEG